MELELDAEQQRCVDELLAAPDKHMLIVAGPGAGKTRTVVAQCLALHHRGDVPQDSMVCITFTNKAAHELKQRLQLPGVRAGTYHNIALATLRQYKVGLFADEYTLLANNTVALRVFKATLAASNVSWGGHASQVMQLYAKHRLRVNVNDNVSAAAAAAMAVAVLSPAGATLVPASAVRQCFQAYEAHKAEHFFVDFDDLLHMWLAFLLSGSADAAAEHAKTRFVFADEVQDSNDVQHAILAAFHAHGATLVAVGDADQSIYGFRGSNMQHIMEFMSTMEGARQVELQTNYRSTPAIVQLCEQLIQFNFKRIPKVMRAAAHGEGPGPTPSLYPFKNTRDEAQFVLHVCERALMHGQEVAVLSRTNREVDALAETLEKRRLPFALIKGDKLLEKAHVKQLLLLYKFVFRRDPCTELIADVAALHRVGKGAASKWAADLQRDTVEDSIAAVFCKMHPAVVPPPLHSFRAALRDTGDALFKIHAHSGTDMSAYGAYTMQVGCACVQHLVQLHVLTANSEEHSDLLRLEKLRGEYHTFDAFYDALVLGCGGNGNGNDNDDSLIKIGTIHQAKGLEFDSCVVVGCADGTIPLATSTTGSEVEEERRLLFVAASRAKHQLCFTFAQHAAWDAEEAKTRRLSQFLRPLVAMDCGLIDVKAWKQGSGSVELQLQPPTQPLPLAGGTATLLSLIESFLGFFGRHNKLSAAVHAHMGFKLVDAGVGVVPCPLFDKSAAIAASSMLKAGAQNELMFKRLFLQFFASPTAEWKELVDEACEYAWAGQLISAQRASRLLRGTQADAGMATDTWPQFMEALQLLADRLLAADVQRLSVNRTVTVADVRTTVDLVLGHTLLLVCYTRVDEASASVPASVPVQPLLHMFAQQRLLARSGRYTITTLAMYNMYTGQLWRAPVPTAAQVAAMVTSLPQLMRDTPLVQLLCL